MGKSNREIAAALGISGSTLRAQFNKIYLKEGIGGNLRGKRIILAVKIASKGIHK